MGDWLRDFYDDIDGGRLDALPGRTTEDLFFQMGGMAPIHGPA